MELGVHLPPMRFGEEELSLQRLRATVDAARDCGFALRAQVRVGPAGHCAELLSRYAEAGCERVYLWPLGDEARQLELVASGVAPQLRG